MAKYRSHENTLSDMLGNLEYDLRRNLITKGPVPSLKYMALIKITITFWNSKWRSSTLNGVTADYFIRNIKTYVEEVTESVFSLKLTYRKENLTPIIESVGREIINLFSHQLSYLTSSTLLGLKIYWDSIHWTQQGTIDTLNTSARIINRTRLIPLEGTELDDSSTQKKNFGCDNNLIEKIRKLNQLFPEDFVIVKDKVRVINCNLAFLVLFSKEKMEQFCEIIKGTRPSCYGRVLGLLIFKNEAALQYIWDQMVNERPRIHKALNEIQGQNLPVATSNVTLYVCQRMSQVDLNGAKVGTLCLLLKKLHRISQWCGDVSIARYLHELARTINFRSIIQIIRYCWRKDLITSEDLEQFSYLLKEFVPNFESYLNEQYLLSESVYCEYGLMKLVEFKLTLIKESTSEDKNKLIFSKWMQHFLLRLIIYRGLDMFKTYIPQILKAEQISLYNKNLFDIIRTDMFYITHIVIVGNNYDSADKILLYLSDDIKSVNEFKITVPYVDNVRIVSTFVATFDSSIKWFNYPVYFISKLNKFLNWCFNGKEEEQTRCKSILFNLDPGPELQFGLTESFFTAFKNKINQMKQKRTKWKQLNEYLKWIFFVTEDEITDHKEILARMKRILRSIHNSEDIAFFALLKEFITSCFSQNECAELIGEVTSDEDFAVVIGNALKLEKHRETDNLLRFCYSFDEIKIDEFKEKFMTSSGCSLLLELIESDFKEEKVKALIGWFNPSVETAIVFKDNFVDFISNKRKRKFDEFEGEEKKSDCKGRNGRVDESIKLLMSHAEEKKLGEAEQNTAENDADELLLKLLQD